MRCNVPKVLESLKGFSLKDMPEFMTREQYKGKMEAIVEKYNLRDLIRFHTFVTAVRPTDKLSEEDRKEAGLPAEKAADEKAMTVLTCKSDDMAAKETHQFDYVVVCSGRTVTPHIPKIEGADTFPGFQFHARDYRRPDPEKFHEKRIAVLGTVNSGNDYAIEYFINPKVTETVKVAKMFWIGNPMPVENSSDYKEHYESGRIVLKNGLSKIDGSKLVFADGTEEEVDTIVYATGYKWNFPFLREDDGVIAYEENQKYYGPLYKLMVAINEPHLMFVGMLDCPGQSFGYSRQAMVAKEIIAGNVKLPSKEEMKADMDKYEEGFRKGGMLRYFATFTPFSSSMWDYGDSLYELVKHIYKKDEVAEKEIKAAEAEVWNRIIKGNWHAVRFQHYEGVDQDIFVDDKLF